MNSYRLYGLNIQSDLALPELLAGPALDAGEPDVRIDVSESVPLRPEGARVGEDGCWATPERFFLPVPDVADFLVERGRAITVYPATGIDDASVRLYLLGSAIGALLIQRGYLVLHGNAIQIGEHCLICVGESGAGKSSLAAAFMQQGYRILADDVVPITASGWAIPGMPRIKLWQDAADGLGIATTGLRRIMPGMDKYNVPLDAHYAGQSLPVRWVCVLEEGEGGICIREVGGLERLKRLAENTYRAHFLDVMGRVGVHFAQCTTLAERTSMAEISRPPTGASPADLVRWILPLCDSEPVRR